MTYEAWMKKPRCRPWKAEFLRRGKMVDSRRATVDGKAKEEGSIMKDEKNREPAASRCGKEISSLDNPSYFNGRCVCSILA